MLLIQSLSALDCQEFSSPRWDSGFITQPQLPRRVPSAWIFHDGSCHPDFVPVPVPERWPWIKAPTAVQGMGDSTVYLSLSSMVTSGLASCWLSPSGRLVADVTCSLH